jgi:EAL domain-containing protein (putative c-di-GMP-specific phosphodiesterase class I)/ActR/RegA family two-component response regulator
MKILIIDDESFSLRLLSHQIRRLGFDDLLTHQIPGEALALLEQDISAVHMVLLDLQMPEIDGIEFVRHLARLEYRGALVLVSGEDERILQTAVRLAEAHHLDVRGAVHKPVSPAALAAVLGSTVGRPINPPHAVAAQPLEHEPQRIAEGITNGEFVNVYQPKVRLTDGEVTGMETLVRWQHPEHGLVGPSHFIGIAEEHGLVDALTRVVLHNALAQAQEWRANGYALHIAVNISMESLSALDFPDFVARCAREAGIPPHLLVLEVTESRLMRNPLAVLDVLTRIRLKHIGLSIDDFGTGHSSLSQLRDIPFDELKVDRRFVHGATGDVASRTILEASLAMARQLGMRTVAEGVETREEWDLLRSLGCDVTQGYFVSRPLDPSDVARWLGEWEARRLSLRPSLA